jgi:hypothetical protein
MELKKKLRKPELEVNYTEAAWKQYAAEGLVTIRKPFSKIALDDLKHWPDFSNEDKTWRLYLYSMYWISPFLFACDKNLKGSDFALQKVHLLFLELLSRLVKEECLDKQMWDDHATAYRASYMSLFFGCYVQNDRDSASKGLIRYAVRKHVTELKAMLQSDKWLYSNHTLFQIEGLIDLYLAFPFVQEEFPGLRELAAYQYESFLLRVVSKIDGSTKEHASFYHYFLGARLLGTYEFLTKAGVQVRLDVMSIIRSMSNFAECLRIKDRLVPAIGDTKFQMQVAPKYWGWIASEASDVYTQIEHSESGWLHRYAEFKDGGFYLSRVENLQTGNELYAVFLEKQSVGPHGHFDGGSYQCYWNGEPYIIDSGGPYKYGNKMRYEYFQQSVAHSVVIPDSCEQYLSQVVDSVSVNDWCAWLSRVSFEGGSIWFRVFALYRGGTVVVGDLFASDKAERGAVSRSIVSPHVSISARGKNLYTLRGQTGTMHLRFVDDCVIPSEAIGGGFRERFNTPILENRNLSPFVANGEAYVTEKDGAYRPTSVIDRDLRDLSPLVMVLTPESIPPRAICAAMNGSLSIAIEGADAAPLEMWMNCDKAAGLELGFR